MIVDQGLEVSDLNCMAGVASAFHACVSAHLLRGELSEELLNLFIALKLVLGDSEDLIGLQLGHEPTLDAQPLVSHTLPAAVDILLFRVHFSALFFKLANLHECISSGKIDKLKRGWKETDHCWRRAGAPLFVLIIFDKINGQKCDRI